MVRSRIVTLKPSRTLAEFLGRNTLIPSLVWWSILSQKRNMEERELKAIQRGKFSSYKENVRILRSGTKYFSRPEDLSFRFKFLNDIYKMEALSNRLRVKKYKFTNKQKASCVYHKQLYEMVVAFIHHVLQWHYFASICLQSFTSTRIKMFLKEISEMEGRSKYKTYCLNHVDILKKLDIYFTCKCEISKKRCEKCLLVQDELYSYSQRVPIILHNVYQLI